MKLRNQILLCLFALLLIAGCALTKVTSRDEIVTGKLPRPNTILVHDFAATPEDVPDHSALAGLDKSTERPKPLKRSRLAGSLVLKSHRS